MDLEKEFVQINQKLDYLINKDIMVPHIEPKVEEPHPFEEMTKKNQGENRSWLSRFFSS